MLPLTGWMTRNALTTFAFNSAQVRVIEIDGQPWFVAADVCAILGLREHPNGGYSNHTARLDANERRITHMSEWGLAARGRTTLIAESGLYKLVMRSDKPEAKPFQNWVTQVVLPAIRKDGAYVLGEEKDAFIHLRRA